MNNEVFEWIDEFGPEEIVIVNDARVGMKGALVIDNTARGVGVGGIRMAPDLKLSTVRRLARGMTWKNAMVDLKLGGAKSGIVADPKTSDKEEIIRSFARALRNYISIMFLNLYTF